MPVGDGFVSEDADAPLIAAARAAFPTGGKVGLAVSGGSDSMAMLHLVASVAADAGWQVSVVTVDHGLRPEAAVEAAFVGEVCAGLGLPHVVRRWAHGPISGNIMQAAREARYRLIADWAAGRGIAEVALAHTANDQAETFLMGLARSAGLEGLSGMRPAFQHGGVTFRRPFLHIGRAALRVYLQRQGLAWVDDPTNEDDRFTRVRARRALRALGPLGVTADRLARVVQNLAAAQGMVADAVRRAAGEVVVEEAGALRFDRVGFLALGSEVNRLLLQAILVWMAGLPHAPRADHIQKLQAALAAGRDATLAGCRFLHRDGQVIVVREARALGGPVPVGALWDGRWRVTGALGEVRVLGGEGLRQCPDWRNLGLAREVLLVTPGVWRADRLIAAPLAGLGRGYRAGIERPFHLFGLSH